MPASYCQTTVDMWRMRVAARDKVNPIAAMPQGLVEAAKLLNEDLC